MNLACKLLVGGMNIYDGARNVVVINLAVEPGRQSDQCIQWGFSLPKSDMT